ncbi:MAG TPA: hypothetical protein VMH39_09840 [Gemmatimonadaceae bacterium]|nr:hypothetical protein [Gemmatimonadaceae bacterium]
MHTMKRCGRAIALASLIATAVSTAAVAQTDEIQVYDASIAAVGVFNLTWHNNYVANGSNVQAFPGAAVADKSWNGVPEWAYGVAPWFEAGLYMPLYSHDRVGGFGFNGFKLRTLFVSPHADDRTFCYGINFEFSYNAKRWDDRRITQEIRPILGWHLKPWDIIVNPIVDTKYLGGIKGLEAVPAARIAYNVSDGWAIAGEDYADMGPIGQLQPWNREVQQFFAVVDRTGGAVDVEAGAGFALTNPTDKLTFKLILSRDLNKK